MLRKILNKAPYRIFLTLFIIVVIAFSSGYLILRNATSAIYNQTRQNARLTAKSMVKSFDESFKEVNNTIYTVNLLHYQIYDESGYKGLNMSNIVQLYNDARQMITQDYIYDFVIHFKESQLAITSEGTTDFTEYFNKELGNITYTSDFWKKFADTKHSMRIIPAADYIETTLDNKIYSRNLIGVVGNNKTNNTKMNVLVFIDVKKLLDRVNQQNMAEGSSLIVLDQDRNIILNTDNNFDSNILDNIYFGKTFEKSIQDKENEYYSIKSRYNDFIYITKIPFVSKSMRPEIKNSLIIIAIAFLLTLGVCILLGYYLYSPLKKIFLLLKNDTDGSYKPDFDEAVLELKQLQKENQYFRNRMELLMEDVRRSVFFKMVNNSSGNGTYGRKLTEQIELHFSDVLNCSSYFMLAVQIEKAYIKKDKNNSLAVSLTANFENTIRQQLGKLFDFPFVFSISSSVYAALIGMKESYDRKQVLQKLGKLTEALKEEGAAGYIITIAASRCYTDIKDCPAAYSEVRLCLAYRLIKTEDAVLDYEELDPGSGMYLPGDQLEKLLNYIASGNASESKVIIENIISGNLANGASYARFTNVISSIFYNIINTLELENYDEDEILKLEIEFHKKMNGSWNYRELQLFLDELVDKASNEMGNRKQSKLNREFILEFINLHYAEDLHLEKMAGMTETSPKYFSNFFKKAIGVNFIEYLNKIRIQHAKELLKNSDILISDIGVKVGYANSSTFTSTFKKYCGISPVEYRKDFR